MSDKVRQTQSEAFGLKRCMLASAIGRPPNNCSSFTTINCTESETYLKLYSHYPENAAISHTVFTFSSSSSLLEISLCISRTGVNPAHWGGGDGGDVSPPLFWVGGMACTNIPPTF